MRSVKLYNGYIIRGRTVEEMYPKLLEASDCVFSYLERGVLLMNTIKRIWQEAQPL